VEVPVLGGRQARRHRRLSATRQARSCCGTCLLRTGYRPARRAGKIAIDKSGSNKAAIVSIQADSGLAIAMRQSKYPNNIVEQDHRAIKRVTRPMLEFKTFRSVRIIIAGIETMDMIRKGQLGNIKDQASSAANQFYSLAF
jgi:transposase-like protein